MPGYTPISIPSAPPISQLSRWLKKAYFLNRIAPSHHVLDVGAGAGWVCDYLRRRGMSNCLGIDVMGQPDLIGDVRDYLSLGLEPESWDVVVAFEMVEHADCWQAISELLRPGGVALITTPVPHLDWFLKIVERLRLTQWRTTPHTHLLKLSSVRQLELAELRVLGPAQWAVMRKPGPDQVNYPAPCSLHWLWTHNRARNWFG